MALKCANCGASVHLTERERRRLAGQFFACPDCGDTKRLPPLEGMGASELSTLQHRWRRWSVPLAVAAVTILVGVFVGASILRVVDAVQPVQSDNAELETIRGWLKEHSDSGHWEEIKWWPVRTVKTNAMDEVRAARLKFREHNAAKSTTLKDVVFAFSDDGSIRWSVDVAHETMQSTTNAIILDAAHDVIANTDGKPTRKEQLDSYYSSLPEDSIELMRYRRSPLDLVRLSAMKRTSAVGFEVVRWWPPREVKTRVLGVVQACRLSYRVTEKNKQSKGDVIAVIANELIAWERDFGLLERWNRTNSWEREQNLAAEEILATMDNERN